MNTNRLFALLGLTVGLFLPAGSAHGTEMADERLAKTIVVEHSGSQLADILGKLSADTGVTLYAAEPMNSTVLVCRYHGTLSGFMDLLVEFMSPDRNNQAHWEASGRQPRKKYTLVRDLTVVQAMQKLVEEANRDLSRKLEEAITTTPGVFGGFSLLPKDLRDAVSRGRRVSLSSRELGGTKGSRHAMERALGEAAKNFGDNTEISYFMAGNSIFNRSLVMTVREDRADDTGQQYNEAVVLSQVFADLAIGKQQAKLRARSPHSTPPPKSVMPLDKEWKRENPVPKRQFLLHLAREAKVNLIADDRGFEVACTRFPEKPEDLAKILDRFCEFQPGGPLDGNQSAFWRYTEGTYIVRSLSWMEDEALVIPSTWLSAWQKTEQKTGRLLVNDILGMAKLDICQIPTLSIWYPKQAEALREAQLPLRWVGTLSASMRERVFMPPGVPISWMDVDRETLDTTWDSLLVTRPACVEIVRQRLPENLNLIITEGFSDEQRTQPAMAVLFELYRNGERLDLEWLATVPLTR